MYLLQKDNIIVNDCKMKISINSEKHWTYFVISDIQPEFNSLCKNKQAHLSRRYANLILL